MPVVEINLVCELRFRHNIFLFSATLSHAANKWKSFNCEISGERKYLDSQEKVLSPKNTNVKEFCTHKISTRKTFVPTKYPQKKFQAYKIPTKKSLNTQSTREKKIRTHEIPMIKTFVSTKYRRRHNGTRPMRLTMAHNARNLAHPIKRYFEKFCQLLSIFAQESLFNKFVGLQSAASFKKNYLAEVFSK